MSGQFPYDDGTSSQSAVRLSTSPDKARERSVITDCSASVMSVLDYDPAQLAGDSLERLYAGTDAPTAGSDGSRVLLRAADGHTVPAGTAQH